jgi:hypothetical protein
MDRLMLLLNFIYVIFIYHCFWVSSPPTQWCLGCNQTFQFAPRAPHHNHHDYLHVIHVTQLLCLESIKCFNFQFGKEGFEPFLPSMVPTTPSFMKFFG